MKTLINKVKIFAECVFMTIGLSLLPNNLCAVAPEHESITIELIKLLEHKPEIKEMLEESIEIAKSKNPDIVTNPAQNLKRYYSYIDTASRLIPQQILDLPADLIREQILQSICYFYFLVDQPLEILKDSGYFNNSLQYYPPFSNWLWQFAWTWGKFLDTEESWTPKTFKQFRDDPQFGLKLGWYESSFNWKTFNQFFSRQLRDDCERPIGCPGRSSIVVSPADSEPQGVWPIDKNSNINFGNGIKVKLATYYNVNDLLSEDSKYKDFFANGKLTHTFLNVFDYHRYHFAVGGTVKEKKIIKKNVVLEVSWSEEKGKYIPIDSEGWQFTQTRGYVIVDTKDYGYVALIPMGMAQVSSVNFEKNVEVDTTFEKGDPLGYFLFGGSDFIMLFQEKAGFELMTQQNEDKKTYKHILMGQKYGVMNGK